MIAIVAADKNWGIGKDNRLLFSIPGDMKYFREKTTGHVIVMGRKTLESFPNGNPLKNRVNIVMTRNKDYQKEGIITVHDINELQEVIKEYDSQNIFVIGGDSVYRQLIGLCDTAYVTKIDARAEADTFFLNLDEDPDWEITDKSETFEHEGLKYVFFTYSRRKD